MFFKITVAIYHTQYFDHPFNFIEWAKVLFERGENREAYLLRGKFAILHTDTIVANTADYQSTIFF